MSGVDTAGLVERLRAIADDGDTSVNDSNTIARAADALLAQAAELAEARERETALEKWRDYYRELLKATEQVLGESRAEIGELKDRLKNSYFESYARELCYRLAAENEAKRATRQRDEALAALKASEERGERLALELAEQREATAFADENRTFQIGRVEKLIAEQDKANERIAELEGALAPFAREADEWHDDVSDCHRSLSTEPDNDYANPGSETVFTIGDLRRARSALKNGPAGLADATNNPPSDPGTEQEAGRG